MKFDNVDKINKHFCLFLVDSVNIFVYYEPVLKQHGEIMKQREFLRWLKAQGVEVSDKGGNHIKLRYKGRPSVLPRHPSQEITTGTYHAVLKQLGLK